MIEYGNYLDFLKSIPSVKMREYICILDADSEKH